MSRPSSTSQRPLTLTEELEKLEQSITLTLQEIDNNFSQAHRIVITSILPIVEQYAENSRDVWEGSKFWKQFFEASANVSLSGYEENPGEDTTSTTQDQTVTEEDSTGNVARETLNETPSYETPSSDNNVDVDHRPEDLDLSSLAISSHSTPRADHQHHQTTTDANDDSSIMYSSPYENLRKQVADSEAPFDYQDTSSALPSTPGRPYNSRHGHPDISVTPTSSPFVPPVSHGQKSASKRNHNQKPSDPILHHVLDKTYRVQATPHGKGYGYGNDITRSKYAVTPKNNDNTSSRYPFEGSPLSSPEPEAPQLHTELFSPMRTPGTARRDRGARSGNNNHSRVTPRPGISVLTPVKHTDNTGKEKRAAWDSDGDDFDDDHDDGFGASPPKTMQFHIPQNRLVKTPAKEASRRIVTDLLTTAGADSTTDDLIEEQSPSVIQRVDKLEDETF